MDMCEKYAFFSAAKQQNEVTLGYHAKRLSDLTHWQLPLWKH
jgi:hypothetical protein